MNAVKKHISLLILFVIVIGSNNFLSAGRFDKLKEHCMAECDVDRLKQKPRGGFRSPCEVLFHELEQEDPDPRKFQEHLYISSSPNGDPVRGVVNFLESVFEALLGTPNTEKQLKALVLATYKTPAPFREGLFFAHPLLFRDFKEYQAWGKRSPFPLRFKGHRVLCSVRGDSIAKAPVTWGVEWNEPWCTGSPERREEDGNIKRVFSTSVTRWRGLGRPLPRIKCMFVLKYAPEEFGDQLCWIFRKALETEDTEELLLFVRLPKGNLHRPTADFLQRVVQELMKNKKWVGRNVQTLLEGPTMPQDFQFSPGTWETLKQRANVDQYSVEHLMLLEDLPLAVQKQAAAKIGRNVAAFSPGDYRVRLYAWGQGRFSGEARAQQALLEEVKRLVLQRIDATPFQDTDQALNDTVKFRFSTYWESKGASERYHFALMMAAVEANEDTYTSENSGRPPFLQFLRDAFCMEATAGFTYDPVIFGLRNIDVDVKALVDVSQAFDKLKKRIELWKEVFRKNPEGFPLMFFNFYRLPEGHPEIEESMRPRQLLQDVHLLRYMQVSLYTEAFGEDLRYQEDRLVRQLFEELRTEIEERARTQEEENAAQKSEEPDEDPDSSYVLVLGGVASADGSEYFEI